VKLSRANLSVREVASRNEQIPALNRVHVCPDGTTVAGNERMLMAVSPVHEEMASRLPVVGDYEDISPPEDGLGISLDTAHEAEKTLPRDRRTILQQAQITRCDDEVVELMTTNGVKAHTAVGMPMRGRFPSTWKSEVVSSALKATRGRICVNGKELLRIVGAMMKACPDKGDFNATFIEFGSDADGIVMRGHNGETGQDAIAVLNPIDTGGFWPGRSEWEKGLGGKVKKRVRVAGCG